MKTYKIPCTWQMYGTLFIEAESLKQAINIALDHDEGLPSDGAYIDASFEVEKESVIREANDEPDEN